MTWTVGIALVVVTSVLATGCGGGETGPAGEGHGGGVRPGKLPPTVLARADANCRYFLRETKQIGRRALADPSSTVILELTTERLVKPSIPLLEHVADRQQALESMAHDPRFDLYANLFDPIIAIAYERLGAGRVGDPVRSKNLEELLTNIGLEQRQAARDAGLRDCDIDFQHVLLSSLSE
jgi:hypothetical protein